MRYHTVLRSNQIRGVAQPGQRACFGSRKSPVRIWPPRLLRPFVTTSYKRPFLCRQMTEWLGAMWVLELKDSKKSPGFLSRARFRRPIRGGKVLVRLAVQPAVQVARSSLASPRVSLKNSWGLGRAGQPGRSPNRLRVVGWLAPFGGHLGQYGEYGVNMSSSCPNNRIVVLRHTASVKPALLQMNAAADARQETDVAAPLAPLNTWNLRVCARILGIPSCRVPRKPAKTGVMGGLSAHGTRSNWSIGC